MNGLTIEIEKIVDVNRVIENTLIIAMCYLFITLVVKLFLRYKKRLMLRNEKVNQALRLYQNPLPMFRLIFTIGVLADILLLWTVSVYPFPYIAILITLSIVLAKIRKILKIAKLDGVDIDDFEKASKAIIEDILPKGKKIVNTLNDKEETNDANEN